MVILTNLMMFEHPMIFILMAHNFLQITIPFIPQHFTSLRRTRKLCNSGLCIIIDKTGGFRPGMAWEYWRAISDLNVEYFSEADKTRHRKMSRTLFSSRMNKGVSLSQSCLQKRSWLRSKNPSSLHSTNFCAGEIHYTPK